MLTLTLTWGCVCPQMELAGATISNDLFDFALHWSILEAVPVRDEPKMDEGLVQEVP